MRLNVADIRRAYPDPVSAIESGSIDYCVLGALVHSVRAKSPEMLDGIDFQCMGFPDEDEAGKLLARAYPRLELKEATEAADDVIAFNDAGQFDKAWAVLDHHLNAWATREEDDADPCVYVDAQEDCEISVPV